MSAITLTERSAVYIALLDEGTKVWRPVAAEWIEGESYLICDAVPDGESWEFQPGDVVRCTPLVLAEGRSELVAVSRVDRT